MKLDIRRPCDLALARRVRSVTVDGEEFVKRLVVMADENAGVVEYLAARNEPRENYMARTHNDREVKRVTGHVVIGF